MAILCRAPGHQTNCDNFINKEDMILIFELDIEISTVYWLYKNKSNRTSNKKVINKVHELFVHPS